MAVGKFNRSKVRGMLIGGAVGDALGMAVETWTPERILQVHPKGVEEYVPPIEHKWFKPEEMPPGSTTDDTQLTVATLEGIMNGHEEAIRQQSFVPYMDAIAKAHVESMKHTVGGWGRSTTEAVRRIANGVHWSISGKTTEKNRGFGNGVPMKCGPLALWYATKFGSDFEKDEGATFRFNQRLVEFSAMTHYTNVSAHAGIIHTWAVVMCLLDDTESFVPKYFLDLIADDVWRWAEEETKNDDVWNYYDVSHLEPCEQSLQTRMSRLAYMHLLKRLPNMSQEDIRREFGNGSCYVYDSLPFSYAWFLKDYDTFDILFDVVNAGGDTDTNAKIVGEMLGALHGIEIFEKPENRWSIEGLQNYDKLIALADRFCDLFGVN